MCLSLPHQLPLPVTAALPCASVSRRWCSSSSSTSSGDVSTQGVTVAVCNGLPQLTVPLPSRRDLCRFTLRPVTHTVQDLVHQLTHEDHGIDRVVLKTTDGVRISSSDSIESLLMSNFDLIINDVSYRVVVPEEQKLTLEELSDMGDVRQLVNKLYMALNVDQHQVMKERDILAQIEDLKSKLAPLEKQRDSLVAAAERRTTVLAWAGLGYMALQFGFLARLTWWEYSWDIMEPVTYFVTYGTAIGAYAYYVVTKQDFVLPEVRDRQFLLCFHKKAKKLGMNVEKYNLLKNRLAELQSDLQRLRDPLALNLPHSALKEQPTTQAPLAKAQQTIKNLLGIKEDK
ncbi:calcium uniporter protein, mitochondrial isoform X2 [Cherax quadricarinatus]|uniref:calcium uniporter protein, mitochondrial isoform X2 n=1 Tax=Cherax quadricarinatus TaxID=27406 RepID=UPI0023794904|nr:calcium uniporter protein, mitochondrial-like isoform X2 [Cherax quadricarinatus]